MKKNICLSLLMVCILSCENDITPINIEDFSVQRIITDNGGTSIIDNFSYDVNGKLTSATRFHKSNPDFKFRLELIDFQYNGDVLISKTHRFRQTDSIHQQVSYTYLPNGALHQTLHAEPFRGVMGVQRVDTYEYNTDGSLRKKTSVNSYSMDRERSKLYYWENGNVSKIGTYDNSQLRYEQFYKYDKSKNFKKGNPFFSDYEIGLATNNNMIEVELIVHSGIINGSCSPCSYSYEYNDYNLPIQISGPPIFGQVKTISYEIVEGETN